MGAAPNGEPKMKRLQTVAAIMALLAVIAVVITTGTILMLGVPVQIGETS